MIKILWSSVTPTIESGYGRVSREVVSRLVKRGYDVIFHGYQSIGNKHCLDGIFQMLDSGLDCGMNVLERYFKTYNRDVLITLYDVWGFFGKIERFQIPWIPYIPIDATPVTIPIFEPLQYAYKRIVFSKFGQEELKKVNLDSHLIYHGVNTKIFKPFSKKERLEYRRKVGVPDGTFLVGTVGLNRFDRKDFPRMIRIFSEFVKKNNAKDALLYFQASPDGREGQCYSLMELGRLYGIEKQLRFDQSGQAMHDTGLAKMYNTLDVYLSTSRAEGCGLPILEAQACGVPAIVAENSAQPEWVRGHGWVVPCSDHIVVLTTPMHNKWYLVDVDKCVEALTEAYQNKELRRKYGKMARKEMLKYDWDKIVDEQWIPFLEKVEDELYGGNVKLWAGGNMFSIRKNKIDRVVVVEVVINKAYSRFLNLTKNDVWLDVGGHIGTFSVDISDKVKKVYTFEPEKENFEFLKKNIRENKKKNIVIFNKALVSNQDKERKFFLDGVGNTGGHSLIAAQGVQETTVQCENINKILKEYKINKIKMDCEGAEYELIKTIDFKKIDELVFEYHFNLLGLAKFEELLAYLNNFFENVESTHSINPFGQCVIYCSHSKRS